MKCPCCGQETDAPYIINYNAIHAADGTRYKVYPSVAKIFRELHDSPIKADRREATHVMIRHLRKFLAESKFPLKVVTENGCYHLVRTMPNE